MLKNSSKNMRKDKNLISIGREIYCTMKFLSLTSLVLFDTELSNAFNPFFRTVPTCAVRETASLGIMGAPRVPPLNPSESIVL